MNCAIYPDSKISGVATVPTVYGIETSPYSRQCRYPSVATAPTVYGIETGFFLQMD